MSYAKTKIYSDGSHYIGIPQYDKPIYTQKKKSTKSQDKPKAREPTVKDEFNSLYNENLKLSKSDRKEKILQELKPKFKDEISAKVFIENNMQRVERNKTLRMIRLMRKVRLQPWNYFCTFTYDDKKHNEDTFRKTLKNCLCHLSSRKGWKYIGAWERSPKNNRLHFHCILYVPDNSMIGEIVLVKDYDTVSKKMQETYQNTHFLEKFGRNDFKSIVKQEVPYVLGYLLKYISKSGESLVYSRGLPTYFISDILDDDVVCSYGIGDRKILLFDNFTCIDDGEIIGEISQEVIEKLKKCN